MVLLEIYADAQLKDGLVDRLLEDGFDDFYYIECHQYAATSLLLSEKEQVSGRKEYGIFKIFAPEATARTLAQKIYTHFGTEGLKIFIHLSISPITPSCAP
ncbi:hypothetical protein BKH46_06785 [Helicobacter sp. 12S02634-8]|uniref:DUF3240 family protein n=1 Tax=Helicobacter sp. 12S02634-8 TaxID=1476199 RepID=UPI000BA67046|nr:DUF3240 family protein [Helicobacter sp. 12S02634-8]PAF46669.1 hypothetical protein BKH46_06785 [Helicobacter sp. 12S02634-8]